jgi:hypothetical protein
MGSHAGADIVETDEQTKEQNIRLDLLKGYIEAAYNKAPIKAGNYRRKLAIASC